MSLLQDLVFYLHNMLPGNMAEQGNVLSGTLKPTTDKDDQRQG